MHCKLCLKNETDSSSGICSECMNKGILYSEEDVLKAIRMANQDQKDVFYGSSICSKCFGKGYSTQLRGDNETKIRYCTCQRGKDLVKYFRLKKDSDVQLEIHKSRIPVDLKKSELVALAKNEIEEWQIFLKELKEKKWKN